MLTECDANGANPVKVNSSDMTILTTNVNHNTFTDANIDANDYIGWSTTSISGAVSRVTITITYVLGWSS